MIIVILIVLGLCFGSFVNAYTWRTHEQSKPRNKRVASDGKLSITKGRSMCPSCQHELSARDLLPVISWVSLRGRCRYCSKPIAWQYPLVELGVAGLFVISYLAWPRELDVYGWAVFGFWLVCITGFMALVISDLRWMILPNRIVFALYWVAGLFVVLMAMSEQSFQPFWSALIGVLIGGGLFYAIFMLSNGTWIGGGDVKLGFLLGALVGGPIQALLLLFVASFLGSMISIPLLVSGRAKRTTRIPFGPFLILGCIVVALWGQRITDWYINTFIG